MALPSEEDYIAQWSDGDIFSICSDDEAADDSDLEWILSGFAINREQVTEDLGFMRNNANIMTDRSHAYPRDTLLLVDHQQLFDTAMAWLLFLQPALTSDFMLRRITYEDGCRSAWIRVASALDEPLRHLSGRVMDGHVLSEILTREVVDAIVPAGQPMPGYSLQIMATGHDTFRMDVCTVLFWTVQHAHKLFEDRMQNPWHLPAALPLAISFNILDASFKINTTDALTAWQRMASTGFETHFIGKYLPNEPCRVEYFPLLATAIATLLEVKPAVPDDLEARKQLCHDEWRIVANAFHEILYELQFEEIPAVILFGELTARSETRLWEAGYPYAGYGSLYKGGKSFWVHQQMVIDQIVFEAMYLQYEHALGW